MKKTSKKGALLLVALSAGMITLGGCKSTATIPLNFVAVTATEWDTAYTFGDYSYQFKGSMSGGNKFVLKAIAVDKVGGEQQGGQQGGEQQGGQQGEGSKSNNQGGEQQSGDGQQGEGSKSDNQGGEQQSGDGQQGEGSKSDNQESNPEFSMDGSKSGDFIPPGINHVDNGNAPIKYAIGDDSVAITSVDYSFANFQIEGTYTKDAYGYIITFADKDDDGKDMPVVIHVDYNKTEGRHEFYYNVRHEETKQLIKFQAKDAAFGKTLPADYKTWDERDSKYIFYARATGNNSSVATAYLYLHSDGGIVENTPNQAQRSINIDMTWTEENGVITVKDDGVEYKSEDTVKDAAHPGKRILMDDKTYLLSSDPNIKWKKMTPTDFDGKAKYHFTGEHTTSGPDGSTKQMDLYFHADGRALMYSNINESFRTGTWEEDDKKVITMTVDEDVCTSFVNDDGVRTINYSWSETTSKGSKTTESNYSIEFTEKAA